MNKIMMLLTLFLFIGFCDKAISSDFPVLGVTPINDGYVVVNHNSALPLWINSNYKNKTLVHIDTHDDIRYLNQDNINSIIELFKAGQFDEISNKGCTKESCLYNEGNWIYAGAKIGVFKDVYWVVPYSFFMNKTPVDEINKYLKDAKFKESDIATFNMKNGIYSGFVDGIPFNICDPSNISEFSQEVLLSVDIDFFPAASTIFKSSLLDSTVNLLSSLKTKKIKIASTVISASVEYEYLPPYLFWITDFFKYLIRNPKVIETRDFPSNYVYLQKIQNLYEAQNYSDLDSVTHNYLMIYGDDSNFINYRSLAMLYVNNLSSALNFAGSSCDYTKYGCYMYNELGLILLDNNRLFDGSVFFETSLKKSPKIKYGLDGYALALLRNGNVDESLKIYKLLSSERSSFPYDFIIGTIYLTKNDKLQAEEYYKKAVDNLNNNPYHTLSVPENVLSIRKAIDYFTETNNTIYLNKIYIQPLYLNNKQQLLKSEN